MKRKAIFIGTIKNGFSLAGIANDEMATYIYNQFHNSVRNAYCEVINISDFSDEHNSTQRSADGKFLAMLGSIQNGIVKLYGPFASYDDADDFSEAVRCDDEEWTVLEVIKQD